MEPSDDDIERRLVRERRGLVELVALEVVSKVDSWVVLDGMVMHCMCWKIATGCMQYTYWNEMNYRHLFAM